MAKKRKGRPVNGIVLLDKPYEISSNKALQILKKIYNAQKAGHTGSLDPLATGMLPICFGEATKVSGFLLDADKSYSFDCKLGEVRSTGDVEGEVLESFPVPELSEQLINSVLETFIGEIDQIPPMYSAIKQDGKRLYKLARKGVEVERKPRRVTIHKLKLIEFSSDTISLEVKCSKGTYVRSLAQDIAENLGSGAYVSRLHRTSVEPFPVENILSLDQIRNLQDSGFAALDSVLLPIDRALPNWPSITLNDDMVFYFRRGQQLMLPGTDTKSLVKVYDQNKEVIGIAEGDGCGGFMPKKVFQL
ncbi:MAG: tRNA pseudouridine(55) synthase TruB [Gammaproteobacteria bacterium]|nr:MAG: tRNA pseudouridine(55) synthase TruB [Gammaproteobacteria bacterium]